MGHSSVAITLDRYGHLMPGNEAEAAELLDAYLDRSNWVNGKALSATSPQAAAPPPDRDEAGNARRAQGHAHFNFGRSS